MTTLASHALVRVRAPDGQIHELIHGDLIGRLWSAALQLDDSRVSEAHAMISLREEELRLIALRGAFAVDGHPVSEATLKPGMKVQLARGLHLDVVDVVLPSSVLGVEAARMARQILPPVASLLTGPRLVRGHRDAAEVTLWCTGDGWRARAGGGEPRPLHAGDVLAVGDQEVRVVEVPLSSAGQAATRRGGGVDAPLTVVALYDSVHVHRDGRVAVTLGGILARMVSELVAMGGPVGWRVLAEELWPDEADESVLRGRLDANLSRIRRKLRAAAVRTDLVRTDGAGTIELVIYPHDTLEDRT